MNKIIILMFIALLVFTACAETVDSGTSGSTGSTGGTGGTGTTPVLVTKTVDIYAVSAMEGRIHYKSEISGATTTNVYTNGIRVGGCS
jgi:hypothetical protein